MNPFDLKPKTLENCIVDWKTMAQKPYNKNTVDPYTKLRIILMNGTEFESVWLGHQFSRHCADNDLRRQIALLRRSEQQQQKRIAALKPPDETILEHTIGYEMLAVDLTSALAQKEPDPYVKKALDFALLEDFDHLYRYADLLEGAHHIDPAKLVGKHIEIMPARPTIAHYRHPYDDIRCAIGPDAALLTKLQTGIITAAEQQTMNYYMNIAGFYENEPGRQLYAQIAMVEEQHVSHYGSLKDPNMTWLECLLMHEYTECYLYYSCMKTECDPAIRCLWEEFFEQEVSHLHAAAELLKRYEGKDWCQLIPEPAFPQLLELVPSKDYVRRVMETVRVTSDREGYCCVGELPENADFFRYQQQVNHDVKAVASHTVIRDYIAAHGEDWRWQEAPHPIPQLDDRQKDNTKTGRDKQEGERWGCLPLECI